MPQEQTSDSAKTLVLLLDGDGSIYNRAYYEDKSRLNLTVTEDYPYSFDGTLQNANGDLFAWICDQVVHERYTQLVIMSGSNRVSYAIDLSNAKRNHTGLFNLDLDSIKTILHEWLAFRMPNTTVTHDPFILTDIANNLAPGTAFKAMSKGLYAGAKKPDQAIEHPCCSSDKVKFIPHYCSLQHIAARYPNSRVIFFDDMGDIINALHGHMQKHCHLIPAGLTVEYRKYAGYCYYLINRLTGKPDPLFNPADQLQPLTGTGEINPDLSGTARHLLAANTQLSRLPYATIIQTLHAQLECFLKNYSQTKEEINSCVDHIQTQTTLHSNPATFFMQLSDLKSASEPVITHGMDCTP